MIQFRSDFYRRVGIALLFICSIGLYILYLMVLAGQTPNLIAVALLLIGLILGVAMLQRYRRAPEKRAMGMILAALLRREQVVVDRQEDKKEEQEYIEAVQAEPPPKKRGNARLTRQQTAREARLDAPVAKKPRRGLFGRRD